ncbi:MAG: hypothetical protein GY749_44295 [Desulfobacteraceae bacterium]|nr:hypothetical protein [Desulfobacteraceae bacterium]
MSGADRHSPAREARLLTRRGGQGWELRLRLQSECRERTGVGGVNTACRLTADLSAETLQARREWQDIFKVMKGKNLQPRLLYPARISFRFDGKIKTFTDKQKLREFTTTKPALG